MEKAKLAVDRVAKKDVEENKKSKVAEDEKDEQNVNKEDIDGWKPVSARHKELADVFKLFDLDGSGALMQLIDAVMLTIEQNTCR